MLIFGFGIKDRICGIDLAVSGLGLASSIQRQGLGLGSEYCPCP